MSVINIKQKIQKHGRKGLIFLGLYIIIKWSLIIGIGSWLHSMGLWKNEYLLFLPAIALTVMGIKRYKAKKNGGV